MAENQSGLFKQALDVGGKLGRRVLDSIATRPDGSSFIAVNRLVDDDHHESIANARKLEKLKEQKLKAELGALIFEQQKAEKDARRSARLFKQLASKGGVKNPALFASAAPGVQTAAANALIQGTPAQQAALEQQTEDERALAALDNALKGGRVPPGDVPSAKLALTNKNGAAAEQLVEAIAKRVPTSQNINQLTGKAQGILQEMSINARDTLDGLAEMRILANDQFFSLQNRALAGGEEFIQKMNPQERTAFLNQRAQLSASVNATFSFYMKAISGATISDREAERLKKSFMQMTDSAPTFKAKMDVITRATERRMLLAERLLSGGLTKRDADKRDAEIRARVLEDLELIGAETVDDRQSKDPSQMTFEEKAAELGLTPEQARQQFGDQ